MSLLSSSFCFLEETNVKAHHVVIFTSFLLHRCFFHYECVIKLKQTSSVRLLRWRGRSVTLERTALTGELKHTCSFYNLSSFYCLLSLLFSNNNFVCTAEMQPIILRKTESETNVKQQTKNKIQSRRLYFLLNPVYLNVRPTVKIRTEKNKCGCWVVMFTEFMN